MIDKTACDNYLNRMSLVLLVGQLYLKGSKTSHHEILLLQTFNDMLGKVLKPTKNQPTASEKKIYISKKLGFLPRNSFIIAISATCQNHSFRKKNNLEFSMLYCLHIHPVLNYVMISCVINIL